MTLLSILQDSVKIKTSADSGVSLKKRHYGKHRSSLLYGGFVDPTAKSCDQGVKSHDQDPTTQIKMSDELNDELTKPDKPPPKKCFSRCVVHR